MQTVQPADKDQAKQSQLAISSVRDMPISYAKGAKFSLSPKFINASFSQAEQASIYESYSKAVNQALLAAGYQPSNNQPSNNQQAEFTVVFGLALQQDLPDSKISEEFGVLPGLSSAERLEKGSFLIYIEDNITNQRIWRGAVQGFVHQDFSPAQREQRAVTVVNSVLSSFLSMK
ncbi:DUF4136 domain-containing protein [Thalassotalea euphylliae]|uniref:DUF4136 domain-containing protein n=1 Tax=Thalassotalea euphylliae TaxID=1655234 RepID=UPI002161D56C|nr:DUF4136 domain-containing protein [Thalassotalea euphylliae]